MKLLEPLAADVRLLTEALDEGASVEDALARVWFDALSTAPSLCGLTVSVLGPDAPLTFTVLASGASADEIKTSLLIPYPPAHADTGPGVTIILHARVPGTFVDLSADLAWLSGRDIADYVLDQHLQPLSVENATAVADDAVINQALGVLVGRGYTIREAGDLLDAAATDSSDRRAAAQAVLDSLEQL